MGQADQVMYRGRERINKTRTRTKPARSSLTDEADEASMRTGLSILQKEYILLVFAMSNLPHLGRVAFQLSHLL